jgi:hypothetical protein
MQMRHAGAVALPAAPILIRAAVLITAVIVRPAASLVPQSGRIPSCTIALKFVATDIVATSNLSPTFRNMHATQ